MGGLVEALRAAVVTRELDLSELDEAYRDSDGESLSLFYRANWTRGQKKRRWELALELEDFRKQIEAGEVPDLKAVQRNSRAWLMWWGDILMVKGDGSAWQRIWSWMLSLIGKTDEDKVPRCLRSEELAALSESAAWEWVTATVIRRVGEYEVETVKKVLGGPSVTSEEPHENPPNSNSE